MSQQKALPSLLVRLFERLQEKEALDLEFKTARGGLPKSLWPTVSAFANTQGGWIVLGVDESQDPSIVGVTNPDQMVQSFYDSLRDLQKISYPVCGALDANIEPLGEKRLVVVRVPAAPRRIRPVFINGNPHLGTYVRRHSGDYRCTRPEVDRMIREASDEAADSSVLAHFDVRDIDPDALGRYRRRFATLNPASPWTGYDDQRFLQAIGGYRRERETGTEGLTVAGLLLFGTEEALREWRTRHFIDYRLALSEDSETRWDDRVPWEGNLLGAFEAIYPKLTEGQPVPFRLEGGTRIDQSPVHVALREALVNLLVHADYAERQASLIKRTGDAYVFRNPGSSRVSENDLLTGDRSDPRNPTLVKMFRLVGLADEAGTGMPKIVSAWRELGFRLPEIETGTERYEFLLNLRHAHLLSDDDRTWLHSLGGPWSEVEQLALVIARHEGEVDNQALRHLTGQHPSDVTKALGVLRDRQLLQMFGVRRGARYQLGPQAYPDLPRSVLGADPRETPAAGYMVGSQTSMEGSGPAMEGNAADPQTSMEDTASTLEGSDALIAPPRSVPPDIWQDLVHRASEARGRRRLDPGRRDALITQLCARAPLAVVDIARLLGRDEQYVRQVVRSLVATDRLVYLLPSQPRHPQQRYTVPGVGTRQEALFADSSRTEET